jgi:hypothetical protein
MRFKKSGNKCHVGRVFDICVEKNSELEHGHPSRKFKGRVVFEGNYVRDENHQAALFRELGANPASMDALRVIDAYAMLPGNVLEQADAQQAYTQAKLEGTPTWGVVASRGLAVALGRLPESRVSVAPGVVWAP